MRAIIKDFLFTCKLLLDNPVTLALLIVNILFLVVLVLIMVKPPTFPSIPVVINFKRNIEVYNGKVYTEYCLNDDEVVINVDRIHFTDFANSKYKVALENNGIKDLKVVLSLGTVKILPKKVYVSKIITSPEIIGSALVVRLPHYCLAKPAKEGAFLIYSGNYLIGKVPVRVLKKY